MSHEVNDEQEQERQKQGKLKHQRQGMLVIGSQHQHGDFHRHQLKHFEHAYADSLLGCDEAASHLDAIDVENRLQQEYGEHAEPVIGKEGEISRNAASVILEVLHLLVCVPAQCCGTASWSFSAFPCDDSRGIPLHQGSTCRAWSIDCVDLQGPGLVATGRHCITDRSSL